MLLVLRRTGKRPRARRILARGWPAVERRRRMYPPSFEYSAPTSLDEALEILGRYGDEAKVLAGGMSLIPVMKLRVAQPSVLVDINRIDGLDGLTEDNGLRIGALGRHQTA